MQYSTYVEKHGYSVVRELVGHGIGNVLHDKPEVPNYGKKGKGIKLEEGMVICALNQ
jgi:methionyl aminopeptidase